MVQEIFSFISAVDPLWIYLTLFFFSFIENVFPPSPSDLVVVFGASMIASTSVDYFPVLLITSIGSALGFILMYYVGKLFGDKIIKRGKIKFLSQEDLSRTDIWFTKYGYKLIIANRFLPGTRSVISFFSGMYELDILKTFLYASISAFIWNAVIIYLGMLLGNNIELIDYYLTVYSKVIVLITVLIIIFFTVRYYLRKEK